MSFNETSQPRLMSDFSLPYLKDIPQKDRVQLMDDRWKEIATKEMYEALDDADQKWERCMELLQWELLERKDITSMRKIRLRTIDWGTIVTEIILSSRNDMADYADAKGIDTKEMCRATWEIAKLLKRWCAAIRTEPDKERVLELALQGIEFLKKADFSPEQALFEYKLAIAKRIKSRTDF